MLTCTPQYDNNTTVGSAHGRYNAHKTWLIVNTIFTYSYYERLHTDYLDKRNLPKLIIRLVLSILPHSGCYTPDMLYRSTLDRGGISEQNLKYALH